METSDVSKEEAAEKNLSAWLLEVGTPFEGNSQSAYRRCGGYMTEKEVVDLGSGDGAGTNEFTRNGYKVTAVDINAEKLSYIKDAETVCNDMEGYLESQPNDSIPNIFCHHSLEHVADPAYVLELIGQKLKPGGICALFVPANDVIRGPHFATFEDAGELVPPGCVPLEGEIREYNEPEHWMISQKEIA